MSLVKVSLEDLDNNTKFLYEVDKSKSLEENISNICKSFEKPYSPSVYGLKLIATNDGKIIHSYLSEDNFETIKDGYFLKLVYSVNHYLKRIFDHITDDFKERSFIDLYELSVDAEFIKEMVKFEKHLVLLDVFTYAELSESEATACLIAIVHLFQRQCIDDISEKFLNKVVEISKNGKSSELVKYALSVLHKILSNRDDKFAKWKEETIKRVKIIDLMNHIKKQDDSDLHYGSLLVMNALIRCCKGEKRQQLIKEINIKQYRETIYKHVITPGNVTKNVARELYIYQTYLLSTYADALTTPIADSDYLSEFEPLDSEVKKMTILMDFDEIAPKNKSASVDNLLNCDDVRISLASMSSKLSEDSSFSHRIQSFATNCSESDSLLPSLLTIEALRHYRTHHYKNFSQSQVEEHVYEPGLLASSERVVRMLAKILRIGVGPDRSSTCYQPTIFTHSSKMPFFFELFSRTMWLLSKTRREMKASTLSDYEKVIHVLAKQVRVVLEAKPMDFKKMTEKMVETSYNTVVEIWQKEKEEELQNVLDTNECIQGLKKTFNKENETNIYLQRINFIKNGTVFPRFVDKKINGNFYAKLSNNCRDLLIGDYNALTRTSGRAFGYSLSDVTHLVEGKACPHVANHSVKDPSLAFSLIINNEFINFKAADRKSASYWTDALNLLLGKPNRSSYYTNEMNELTKMDLVLHLLELQGATIPKRPPPVPRNPFELRPPIPPKPQMYPEKNAPIKK
ncbi:engulfment and cell motility protein 1 isoform X2 [Tribolium castaneum]|uniref:engulfment and cell motility protein 1 isoform X2 n=1 Tax=Tribolium castaneum TaxID=7070 RepID=UPI00046C0B67|nr:PREDICTED: engulfment and cell motility protein 1 isoform X2 [Tribolium castaneum]|eukprot:XP_001815393.2 PREDICTED: engulfment and cell motility protein 1 isoform X2 [Tribolium castaneum]